MHALLDVILPVFLVIGFGYIAVWRGLFPESGVDALMKFSQHFAIPCLLFSAITNLDLSSSFDSRLLISFYFGATCGFLFGVGGARLFFHREWEDCVAIGFCCLFSNSVLLGLAINERAYGPEALAGTYTIIALHSPFCYGLGITAMEIVKNQIENFISDNDSNHLIDSLYALLGNIYMNEKNYSKMGHQLDEFELKNKN